MMLIPSPLAAVRPFAHLRINPLTGLPVLASRRPRRVVTHPTKKG